MRPEPRTGGGGSGFWPTPTIKGNYNRAGASAKSGDGLATAVQKWPTPSARDWRDGRAGDEIYNSNARPLNEVVYRKTWATPNSRDWRSAKRVGSKQNYKSLNHEAEQDGGFVGILNPDWVEWLMGWPIGWTGVLVGECLPWDTDPHPAVPRLVPSRSLRGRRDRLTAIGNGMVPQTFILALAWLLEQLPGPDPRTPASATGNSKPPTAGTAKDTPPAS